MDSIIPEDVTRAVATAGNYEATDVTREEIRHRTSISPGSIWVRCSVTAARKIITARRITDRMVISPSGSTSNVSTPVLPTVTTYLQYVLPTERTYRATVPF